MGDFIFLIFLRVDCQCSNTVIPILRHNQDCNFAAIQYDDLICPGFLVQQSIDFAPGSDAICLWKNAGC